MCVGKSQCNFVTYADSGNQHHNQDTELSITTKILVLLGYNHTHTPPLSFFPVPNLQ